MRASVLWAKRNGMGSWVVDSAAYVALCVVAYLVADRFLTSDGVSLWYPPAALSFVYLVRTGPSGLPVALATRLVIGATVMDAPFRLGNILPTSVLVLGCYTLAAVVFRRWRDSHCPRRVVLALVVTGAAGCTAAALSTMGFVALAGDVVPSRFLASTLFFVLGDASALLTLAPVVLLAGVEHDRPRLPLVEAALVAVLVLGASVAAASPADGHPQLYLTFVPMAWVAMRYGLTAASTVIAGTGLLVPLLSVRFEASSGERTSVQIFMVIFALTGIALGMAETERRFGRTEVASMENRFRAAFEDAPFGVELATDVGVIDVNKSLLEITGRSREELLGDGIAPYLHPDDRMRIAMERTASEARDDRLFSTEVRIVRPGGDERWIRGTIVTLAGDEAGVTRIVHVSDITEAHAAQTELAESQARLEWQAFHDALTGLPNRPYVIDRLGESLARARLTGRLVAVLYLDLDRFKLVNDTLGHATGDRLLVVVAKRLVNLIGARGTVARLGGDEFVILVEGLIDPRQATDMAERINTELAEPVRLGNGLVSAAASIGIAFATGGTPEALLRDADTALYRAKDRGKNRHEVFDDSLRAAALRKVAAEHVLREALDENQLVVHYQPVVDLLSGALLGAEALLRVPGPRGELQSPSEFIAVADETGLIVPIGAGVIDAACRSVQQWRRDGVEIGHVAVNVSPRQLSTTNFGDVVESALEAYGLEPTDLSLELTETALIHADVQTTRTIERLHRLGIGLAIDDFGTGYGSLAYLKRFPVSTVKIDQSFVAGLGVDGDDNEIVRAIASLGRSLGLLVVAEGVETPEQLDKLRALGCDAGQGFLFAPAVPAEDLGEAQRAIADRTSVATSSR